MGRYPPRHPPAPYVSIAPARVDEHRYRCPICHEVVDSRDLDAAPRHREPGHLGLMYRTGQAMAQDHGNVMVPASPPNRGMPTPSTTLGSCAPRATACSRIMCRRYLWWNLSGAQGEAEATKNRDSIAAKIAPRGGAEAGARVESEVDPAARFLSRRHLGGGELARLPSLARPADELRHGRGRRVASPVRSGSSKWHKVLDTFRSIGPDTVLVVFRKA